MRVSSPWRIESARARMRAAWGGGLSATGPRAPALIATESARRAVMRRRIESGTATLALVRLSTVWRRVLSESTIALARKALSALARWAALVLSSIALAIARSYVKTDGPR